MLGEAKALAGRGGLIPADKNKTYIEQLRRIEYQRSAAGIHRVRGHRHQYAQTRYRGADWPGAAPASGPRSKGLTPALRERDREERITISEELGRCRLLALLTCDLKLLEQLFRWLAPVPGPLDKSHSDCAAARRAFNGSRKSRVGSASPRAVEAPRCG